MRYFSGTLLIATCLALTACGQSGPLYLPASKPTTTPLKANAPVPANMSGHAPSTPLQTNNNQS